MTPEHRMKIGAAKLGVTFEEYRSKVESQLKFCAGHRDWHPRDLFGARATAADGLDNHCRELVNERSREYQRWLRTVDRRSYNAKQASQKREQRARLRRAG